MQSRLTIATESVCQRKLATGTIVLQEDAYYFFREVEEDIWENLPDRNIAELLAILAAIYEVEVQVLWEDVVAFLATLRDAGLIDITSKAHQTIGDSDWLPSNRTQP